MSAAWKEFLLKQGAMVDADGFARFGDPQSERRALRAGNIVVDLSSTALIRAHGLEAKNFLDAQLTNDIGSLAANRSTLAAWCSAKGRMLALFRVFRRNGDYYLQLPLPLRDDVVKRLRLFVLRAKVKLDDADAELTHFGLTGPEATALLREAVDVALDADNACVSVGALTVLRLPGMHPRFEIVAPPAEAATLWEQLRRRATMISSRAWAWHDIMAGLPTVLPATSDAWVPQMANLELLGGVSFNKGCYPGQEIVARMQYLGRLKQRMVRARVAAAPPAPGMSIFAPESREQSAGMVVDAQASPDEGSDLLAVVQISSVQAGELHLGNTTGPLLELQPLPYAFEPTR